MSYTITLSGPAHSEQQARNALAAAQFDVHADSHDYGLPPHTDGQAESFVNVEGDDVDRAWDAVRSLGWRLRLHHLTAPVAPPSPERLLAEKFAEYERRFVDIESRLAQPPIRGGAVESPAWANQNSTYGAEQTRRAIASLLQRGSSIGSVLGGIVGSGDCALTPPGSGMSVNVASGEVWVPGSSSATQSGYYCRVSSSTNLAIAASDPSNPRIDRVSAIVTDSAYSGGTNTFAVAVETGTPTAGATLTNLNGVAAAPTSSYTLGYVLVPATATNIVSGDLSTVASYVVVGPNSGWVALSLSTNIASGGYGASARLQGDTVRLKGTLTNNTGSSTTATLATIPAGMRPSGTVITVGALSSTSAQGIQITSAGALSVPTSINNAAVLDLTAATYTLT
jgi:hypothetical protein